MKEEKNTRRIIPYPSQEGLTGIADIYITDPLGNDTRFPEDAFDDPVRDTDDL